MSLDAAVQAIPAAIANLAGTAGIILYDQESGDEAAWNPDEVFLAASLIKLPILWHFFREAGAGRLDPDEPMTLAAADMTPGFGVLRSLQPGLVLRLRDLASLMIVVSDNTATNLLIDRLGIEPINGAIRDLGLAQTVLMRKMYDYRDPAKNNYTSPRDMVRMLQALAAGEGLQPAYQAEAMQMLLGQQCRNKLPSGLPRSARLAHKTGDQSQVEHDAGIFFGAQRTLVVVVMTKDLARNVDGVSLCRQVGEIAYAYAGPNPAEA